MSFVYITKYYIGKECSQTNMSGLPLRPKWNSHCVLKYSFWCLPCQLHESQENRFATITAFTVNYSTVNYSTETHSQTTWNLDPCVCTSRCLSVCPLATPQVQRQLQGGSHSCPLNGGYLVLQCTDILIPITLVMIRGTVEVYVVISV